MRKILDVAYFYIFFAYFDSCQSRIIRIIVSNISYFVAHNITWAPAVTLARRIWRNCHHAFTRAGRRNTSRTPHHIRTLPCITTCRFQHQVNEYRMFIRIHHSILSSLYEFFMYFMRCINFHCIISPSDHNDTEINGVEEGYYPNGSPYRIQRHAANIRERKRMLR